MDPPFSYSTQTDKKIQRRVINENGKPNCKYNNHYITRAKNKQTKKEGNIT
jgi:hypothetical protein